VSLKKNGVRHLAQYPNNKRAATTVLRSLDAKAQKPFLSEPLSIWERVPRGG
jgi:hypothetical protein